MGIKADLLNRYRKEVKAGSYVGTFNEYTGGRFTDRGGATEARLTRNALAEAGKELDAQIRAVGGDPTQFSLQEKRALNINAMAASFARSQAASFASAQQTTTSTVGQSAEDIAFGADMTLDELRTANPNIFPQTSGGIDTQVFAGQSFNTPGTSLADRVAAANRLLVSQRDGGVGRAPTSSVTGGRGARVPTASDFAARARAQQPPSPFSGMGGAVENLLSIPGRIVGAIAQTGRNLGFPIPERPDPFVGPPPSISELIGGRAVPRVHTVPTRQPAAQPQRTGIEQLYYSGRLSLSEGRALQRDLDLRDIAQNGTLEEIMAQSPGIKYDKLVQTFKTATFMDTYTSFGDGDTPNFIMTSDFESLVGISSPEIKGQLLELYEFRPLSGGYYLRSGPVVPGDTVSGSGTISAGGGTFVDTDGLQRSVNNIIRRAVPVPGGGVTRGTTNTGSGFTPTSRAIMWRI